MLRAKSPQRASRPIDQGAGRSRQQRGRPSYPLAMTNTTRLLKLRLQIPLMLLTPSLATATAVDALFLPFEQTLKLAEAFEDVLHRGYRRLAP